MTVKAQPFTLKCSLAGSQIRHLYFEIHLLNLRSPTAEYRSTTSDSRSTTFGDRPYRPYRRYVLSRLSNGNLHLQ